MKRLVIWLISALIVVLVSFSYALDGPSESDAAATVALDLNDAIHQARVAHHQLENDE